MKTLESVSSATNQIVVDFFFLISPSTPESDFFIMLHPQLFLERSTVMRTDAWLPQEPSVLWGGPQWPPDMNFPFIPNHHRDHVVNYRQVIQVLCAQWWIHSDRLSRPGRQPLPTHIFTHTPLTYPQPLVHLVHPLFSTSCWSVFIYLNDPRAGLLSNESAYTSLTECALTQWVQGEGL